MSSTEGTPEDILRPIHNTSKKFYMVLGACLLALGIWGAAWMYQLHHGLIVTGLSDWGSGGGVTWGLYIGAFIWWVGIAHGGIILSAAVRLLGMKRYQPVARMAELLTLFALSAAGSYIVVHTGRPDRMVTSVLFNYPDTIHFSPLVWDVTVITAYFVLTGTYLGLTLRYDIVRLRDQLPDHFEPIYKVMTIGYTKAEDEIIERMVWWVALAIIIMAPLLLHGGVIPWLFALIPSMPGWYSAVQGPQFLTIALSSAVAGIIVSAYIFRRVYDWGHILTDDVFRGLTLWLGFFCLLFLWLQLQQIITGTYHPTVDTEAATMAMLTEPLYWLAIGGVAVVLFGYIFAQAVKPHLFTKRRSVAAALIVLSATLVEKVLFVAEGLMYPSFALYDAVPGDYFPSLIEMSSVLGTIGLVVMAYALVAKVVPIIELHAVEDHGSHDEHSDTEANA